VRLCDVGIVGGIGAALTINVSCVAYDPPAGVATTLVAWQLPASTATKPGRSTWNSTILVQYQTPEGPHMNAHRTTLDHVRLSLAVDYDYEITVHGPAFLKVFPSIAIYRFLRLISGNFDHLLFWQSLVA